MRKLLLLFLSISFFTLQAQDYLVSPTSNPALFTNSSIKNFAKQEKANGDDIRDSVIYVFDTLDLPFIDDFSRNHFYRDIGNIPSSKYSDTLFHRIMLGSNPYVGTEGFVTDTTFIYELNMQGEVHTKTPNLLAIVRVFDIESYPVTSEVVEVYQPYNIYDSINGNKDTIMVEADLFQDSARYYFVDADTNVYYTDRKVYRNNHYAILPPSIGVVTFDGLDENGLPYDIYNPFTVKADELTSVPLRMGNLSDTNVYISFFIQPKGISLSAPAMGDSLVLDFYNPITDKWGTIWGVDAYQADTFRQEIVKIPNQYLEDGARFKFRAYANSTGAFNHWHLDYIYLDADRSEMDTAYRDIAYVYEPNSLLKDYQAMPYWHFQTNPSAYMIDSSGEVLVRNNDDNAASVFNKIVITDTINNTDFYRYPATPQLSIVSPLNNFTFDYPINFSYSYSDIDSAGTFAAEYTIRIGTQTTKDMIPYNDTVYSTAILDNYYAYDDGTAEAGYGINPEQSPTGATAFMAVEFNQPIVDSLGGVQIYFLPQYRDIRTQKFQIKVWAAAPNGGPGNLIYTKEEDYNPMFTPPNGFITYWFDTLIEVPQRYYVGIEAVGEYSMNIGYDLNNNHKDKIFWSFDAIEWYYPSSGIFEGSLMLRPIYRKSRWGVGLNKQSIEKPTALLYPNPNMGQFTIDIKSKQKPLQLKVFNIEGKLVYSGRYQSNVNLQRQSKGLYFINILMEDGSVIHKKVMIQ